MFKTCSKCSIKRAIDNFSKDLRNKDGLQSQCQVCRKAAKQEVANKRRGQVTCIEKTCNKCNKTKVSDAFYRDSGISDGLATICKECRDPGMIEWRAKNRDKYNANMRDLRATNKDMFKNIDLKRTYGIDLGQYNQMLESQNYCCAICNKPPNGKRPLVVDHNHSSGIVRQLLCYGCNRALHVLESAGLLLKAQEYLKKHK